MIDWSTVVLDATVAAAALGVLAALQAALSRQRMPARARRAPGRRRLR